MDSSTEERILDAQPRLYSNDSAESWAAACELIDIGLPALPTLIAALNEPRAAAHVHENVLNAIERLGPLANAAIPQVLRFLNPEIRGEACAREAAWALYRIGETAVEPLARRVHEANELEWRFCKRAMSNLPTGSVVSVLIPFLQEPDGGLRIRVCEILESKSGFDEQSEPAALALIELLGQSDPYVRAAAARALGKIGEVALQLLLPLLKSENSVVRTASISAISECAVRHSTLTRTGNGGIFSLLSDMLADADSSVRIAAAVGMQRAATAIAKLQLDQELRAEDPEGQLLATRSYRAPELRPGKQAIWDLTSRVTHSKDLRLRRQSAATLLACGSATTDGVLETLQKALADPEDPCRDQYLTAAQRGGYWSVPLLPTIAQYVSSDERLAALAIETVAIIGVATDDIVYRLITCLKTAKDARVREAAAEALGQLAPAKTEVVTALVDALNDSEAGHAACHALGKLEAAAASAVPAIKAAVHLGYRVPEALARIRTPDAIAALWRLYNIGYGGYGDHVGRTDQQDLFDRADAELRNLGER